MITWTLVTSPANRRPTVTAGAGELTRTAAVDAAADALRSALMDARSLVDMNGTGPEYRITIDGDAEFTLGTGGTRFGGLDLELALDAVEAFERTYLDQTIQH